MLEILHRAKPLGGGEFVYGYYFKCKTHSGQTVHAIRPQELEAESCYYNSATPSGIEIDPETLGIYIGVQDKSGQNIFTGDVLMLPSRTKYAPHIIAFMDNAYSPIKAIYKNYTIIGNDVENVELVERLQKGMYRHEQ